MEISEKEAKAIELIRELDSVAVAFSGGVDSALVCSLAKEALGDKTIAMIGISPVDPKEDLSEARKTAKSIGIELVEIETYQMADEKFLANPPERCFFCKTALYGAFKLNIARRGINAIVDGCCIDDLYDFRPGMMAKKEFGVVSPLIEVGLTKQEVRELSRKRGLSTWDRPQMACFASRIPYGTRLTEELLDRIERAEEFLRDRGLGQLRVRAHNSIARIEIEPENFQKVLEARTEISEELRRLGFHYVTLDLLGFRSGSMNEVL